MNWKRLFLILLTINLLFIIVPIVLLFQPSEQMPKVERRPVHNHLEMTVTIGKEEVAAIVNNYIAKKQETYPLDYYIQITDRVELLSKIRMFGRFVDFVITFEPTVDERGNIKLIDPEISLGELRLPVQHVLRYIEKNARFPEGIYVLPREKMIYIDFTKLKILNNYQVKAETFDLKNNQITFSLYIPLQNVGQS